MFLYNVMISRNGGACEHQLCDGHNRKLPIFILSKKGK